MKKIIFITLILVLNNTSYSQSNSYDVRNTSWGMTVDEVIKSEGLPPLSKENSSGRISILYETSIEKRPVKITYHFDNNKLSQVDYQYYWGDWQTENDRVNIKSRLYSLSSLFNSLINKDFDAQRGMWYDGQSDGSEMSNLLINCQESSFNINSVNSVEKLYSCYNKIISNSDFKSMVLYYRNQRTFVTVKLPTENYWNNYSKTTLGWVTFLSKLPKSDF